MGLLRVICPFLLLLEDCNKQQPGEHIWLGTVKIITYRFVNQSSCINFESLNSAGGTRLKCKMKI